MPANSTLLTREDWGADPALPRLGHAVGRAERTEVFIHHTVIVDSDATPNVWESLEEVGAKMRQLQSVRPDLGLDVPYSFVAFCMSDGGLVIAEGRGLDRSGAHTSGHNRSALAVSFQGNFEAGPLPDTMDDRLGALGEWLRELREEGAFDNLGSSRPADRQVWGHRDVKATSCPGQLLFDRLGMIRFVDEATEEDEEMAMDQATWKAVQRALQALDPPLYAGKPIDGLPGRNTNTSLRAFESRVELEARGVVGELGEPSAGIWPATRELLFTTAFAGGST